MSVYGHSKFSEQKTNLENSKSFFEGTLSMSWPIQNSLAFIVKRGKRKIGFNLKLNYFLPFNFENKLSW